jgi:AraC-like DNA-binding protein
MPKNPIITDREWESNSAQCPAGETRHLWFCDGVWWYRAATDIPPMAISGILQTCGYQSPAIARELRAGERTFHRRVKDSLGIPPGLWLRQERAVDSRRRLRSGCSIKVLAYDYGFTNPGDFSVEFKRWHGVTPSEFKMASGGGC